MKLLEKFKGEVRIAVTLFLLGGCVISAMGMSSFRDESYHPNLVQREGLALLRIVGSPSALITEGYQNYEEWRAVDGKGEPLMFLTGMTVPGVFVVGFEILGGVVEVLSCQQFKKWSYPWEFDEPDQKFIARKREQREREQRKSARKNEQKDKDDGQGKD